MSSRTVRALALAATALLSATVLAACGKGDSASAEITDRLRAEVARHAG